MTSTTGACGRSRSCELSAVAAPRAAAIGEYQSAPRVATVPESERASRSARAV